MLSGKGAAVKRTHLRKARDPVSTFSHSAAEQTLEATQQVRDPFDKRKNGGRRSRDCPRPHTEKRVPCLCTALQSPRTLLPPAFSRGPRTQRCQGDPQTESLGCFLTLLGPCWAAGWVRRTTEVRRREGRAEAPETACRHMVGRGGAAGAPHAALAPSPTGTGPCSRNVSHPLPVALWGAGDSAEQTAQSP